MSVKGNQITARTDTNRAQPQRRAPYDDMRSPQPVRARVTYVNRSKMFGFASSRQVKGRIYIPNTVLSSFSELNPGVDIDAVVQNTSRGVTCLSAKFVESLPHTQEQRNPTKHVQAWFRGLTDSGSLIFSRVENGRTILVSQRLLADGAKGISLYDISIKQKGNRADRIKRISEVSQSEVIQLRLNYGARNGRVGIERAWWWITARTKEDPSEKILRSMILSAWSERAEWRAPNAIACLRGLYAQDADALLTLATALDPNEWNDYATSALTILWDPAIALHDTSAIYAAFHKHQISDWLSRTLKKQHATTRDQFSSLLISAAIFGRPEDFRILLGRASEHSWFLPPKGWAHLATILVKRRDAERFSMLVRALTIAPSSVTASIWGRLALATTTLGQKGMLSAVTAACEQRNWQIDSLTFGSLAKAAGMMGEIDILAEVANACKKADWPLQSEAWISFFAAVGRVRSKDLLRLIANGALSSATKSMNASAWCTLASQALSLEDPSLLEAIISSWANAGWPIEGNGWTILIAAANKLRRTDFLDSAINSRSEVLGSLSDRHARELLRMLSDPNAPHWQPLNGCSPTYGQIIHRIWNGYVRHTDQLRADVLQAVVRAAAQINDLATIASCAESWPIQVESSQTTLADIAVSLALACIDVLGPIGPSVGLQVLRKTPTTLGCPGSGKINLALRLFEAKAGAKGIIDQNSSEKNDATERMLPVEPADEFLIIASLDVEKMRQFLENFDTYIHDRTSSSAISELQRLNSYATEANDGKDSKYAYYLLARAYRYAREYNEALKNFERAASASADKKNQSVCAYEMGLTHLEKGDPKDALQYFENSIELEKHPRPSQLTKAATAAVLCKKFDKAVSWLELITSADEYHQDERAWLQLGKTLVSGFQHIGTPDSTLNRAASIACIMLTKSTDDRTRKEAAAIAVEAAINPSLGYAKRPTITEAMHTVSVFFTTTRRTDCVEAICDAFVNCGVWTDEVINLILTKLLSVWPDLHASKPLIRCIAAAMVNAYHFGRLGSVTYKHGAATVFSRILSASASEPHGLAFEIFAARRSYVLRKILEEYAKNAEEVVSRFLLIASNSSSQQALSELLTQLSRLVRDQMPKKIEPVGHGGTDAVSVYPLLEKLVERLKVRAGMAERRGEVLLSSSSRSDVWVRHLEWMRVRAAIGLLLPSNAESPFSSVSRVSVPWRMEVGCQPGAISLSFSFPSSIHRSHNPEQLLREAKRALKQWAYEIREQFSVERISFERWEDDRFIQVIFNLESPGLMSQQGPTADFIRFMSEESRRILSGGDLLPSFFEDAKAIFDKLNTKDGLSSREKLAELHQILMDAQFAVTTDWLFLGEGVADKPEYHPRYEVHALKGLVSRASRELGEHGRIPEATVAALQARLLGMRRNILQTLKAATRAGEFSEDASTDIVAVVNHTVMHAFGEEATRRPGGIEISAVAPPSLTARVSPFSLKCALFNLFVNSAEAVASARVHPRITITVENVDLDDRQEYAIITVSNPYDPSASPKKYGTGVGLADARFHIEELNGGKLHYGPSTNGNFVSTIQLRK